MEINFILEFIGLAVSVIGGGFAVLCIAIWLYIILEEMYHDRKIKLDNKINTTVFILMLVCLVVFLVMFNMKNLSTVLTVSDSTFTFGSKLDNN